MAEASSKNLSPIVVSLIGTGIIGVLAAFWQLSDPRADIKSIRDTYLTLREHTEFAQRFTRDVARLEEEQRAQNVSIDTKVSKDVAAEVWKQRDLPVAALHEQIVDLSRRLEVLTQQVQEHERADYRGDRKK